MIQSHRPQFVRLQEQMHKMVEARVSSDTAPTQLQHYSVIPVSMEISTRLLNSDYFIRIAHLSNVQIIDIVKQILYLCLLRHMAHINAAMQWINIELTSTWK